MGSKAAEVLVTVCLITYHRIEGVDHLIGKHAWHTANGKPKERGNDTIAQVLGEGFEGCRADFLGREFGGVAPHDTSHLLASFIKRTVNSQEGLAHLTNKGGASEAKEDDERGKKGGE